MKLYWHPFSLFPRRVRVALREKDIAHEEIIVDLPGGGAARAGVPATQSVRAGAGARRRRRRDLRVAGDPRVSGGAAPRAAAAARPIAARRAEARQLMLAAGDYLAPPFKRWLTRLFLPEESWNRADQDAAAVEIGRHLDVLEGILAGRDVPRRRRDSPWPTSPTCRSSANWRPANSATCSSRARRCAPGSSACGRVPRCATPARQPDVRRVGHAAPRRCGRDLWATRWCRAAVCGVGATHPATQARPRDSGCSRRWPPAPRWWGRGRPSCRPTERGMTGCCC